MKQEGEDFMHQLRSRMRAASSNEAKGTLALKEKGVIKTIHSKLSRSTCILGEFNTRLKCFFSSSVKVVGLI